MGLVLVLGLGEDECCKRGCAVGVVAVAAAVTAVIVLMAVMVSSMVR